MKNLKQTHGALIEEEELDDLFPTKEKSKKSSASLNELNLEQLKLLAEELGLRPIDNRKILIKSIQKELSNK